MTPIINKHLARAGRKNIILTGIIHLVWPVGDGGRPEKGHTVKIKKPGINNKWC